MAGSAETPHIAALPAIADSPAFAPSSPSIRDGPLLAVRIDVTNIFSDFLRSILYMLRRMRLIAGA